MGREDGGVPAESEPLSSAERRGRMLAAVEHAGFMRVAELSEQFGVSAVTVRSDLGALESDGVIRRIRGGAMPAESVPTLREQPFEVALHSLGEEKRLIAARAVDEIEPGMSLLLDVGTTAAAIARELLHRESLGELTVVTSGLSIALLLEPAIPRLQVIVTGGTLRPLQHSLVAPLADGLLPRLRADIAFIGCNGVDAQAGITNINLPEAEVKRAMITASSRAVVVADGSKIGRVHLGRVADATEVDAIVTTASAPADAVEELRGLGGPQLVIA